MKKVLGLWTNAKLRQLKRKKYYIYFQSKEIREKNPKNNSKGHWCYIYTKCDEARKPSIGGVTFEYAKYENSICPQNYTSHIGDAVGVKHAIKPEGSNNYYNRAEKAEDCANMCEKTERCKAIEWSPEKKLRSCETFKTRWRRLDGLRILRKKCSGSCHRGHEAAGTMRISLQL